MPFFRPMHFCQLWWVGEKCGREESWMPLRVCSAAQKTKAQKQQRKMYETVKDIICLCLYYMLLLEEYSSHQLFSGFNRVIPTHMFVLQPFLITENMWPRGCVLDCQRGRHRAVCGSNGRLYKSLCAFQRAQCINTQLRLAPRAHCSGTHLYSGHHNLMIMFPMLLIC